MAERLLGQVLREDRCRDRHRLVGFHICRASSARFAGRCQCAVARCAPGKSAKFATQHLGEFFADRNDVEHGQSTLLEGWSGSNSIITRVRQGLEKN